MSVRLKNSRTGVTVNVSEETAARLDAEWVSPDAAPKAAATEGSTGAPNASWTVPALKAYAAEHGIELNGATRKPDVLAAIAAGEHTGAPASTDGADGAAGDDDNENDENENESDENDDESDEDEDNSDESDDESDEDNSDESDDESNS